MKHKSLSHDCLIMSEILMFAHFAFFGTDVNVKALLFLKLNPNFITPPNTLNKYLVVIMLIIFVNNVMEITNVYLCHGF